MRVVLVADRDPYVGYAGPESSLGGSGLSISVLPTAGWEANRGPDFPAELLVLPASLLSSLPLPSPLLPFFAYGPEELIATAFRAGARDYLREPWSIAELEARAERRSAVRFSIGEERLSLQGRTLRRGETSLLLGETEGRLLALLLLAPGEAVPRKLLEEALPRPPTEASRALDMAMSGLRKSFARLGIPEGACIRACRGRGYRMLATACG